MSEPAVVEVAPAEEAVVAETVIEVALGMPADVEVVEVVVAAGMSWGANFVPREVRGDLVPLVTDVEEAGVAGVAEACAIAASSTVVVSDTVSRKGEREFVIVAGATMVMERVAGVFAAGGVLAAADVVFAGGDAAPLVLAPRAALLSSLVC